MYRYCLFSPFLHEERIITPCATPAFPFTSKDLSLITAKQTEYINRLRFSVHHIFFEIDQIFRVSHNEYKYYNIHSLNSLCVKSNVEVIRGEP